MKKTLWGIVVVLFMNCGSSHDSPGTGKSSLTDPQGVSAKITADQGGTISYKDEATLQVPANSLPQDTEISIERISQAPNGISDGFQGFGQTYKFGPPGTQFSLSKPSQLVIKYDSGALLAKNLDPATLQIFYFDPNLGRYVNVSSQVDTVSGKVTAQVEHFTVYVPMAKSGVPGNAAPTVLMQAPIPTVIRAGAPIYMRATITDTTSFGSIAGATLHYRKMQPAPGAWQTLPMNPELDYTGAAASVGRYVAIIPSTFLTAADLGPGIDLEYYADAVDNLGLPSAPMVPVAVNVTESYVAGSLTVTPAALSIASGFQRVFTFQGTDTAAAAFAIIPEAVTAGSVGNILSVNTNGALYKATTSAIGALQGSFGSQTATSAVTVFAGALDRLEVLDTNGNPFSGTFSIKEGHKYEFDARGYDAFGNSILVLPNWSANPVLGSVTVSALPAESAFLYTLDAALGSSSVFGQIQIALGNKTAVQNIQVLPRFWNQKGGSLNNIPTQNAYSSSIAFAGATPYVSFFEVNTTSGSPQHAHVMRWNGSSWAFTTGAGPSGLQLNVNSSINAGPVALAVTGSTPYATWHECTGVPCQVYVKYLAGTTWVEPGGIPGTALNVNTAASAENPSIAFSGATPYVVWREKNGPVWQIFVKHWTGTGWVQDGGALNVNPSNDGANPVITVIGTTPYVVWSESTGGVNQTYVKYWSAGSWNELGGTGVSLNVNTLFDAYSPAISFSGTTPYVTWYEFDGTTNQIRVKYWNGSAWVSLGGSLNVDAVTGVGYTPSIGFFNGTPYVTWMEGTAGTYYRIFVKHWNGSAWVQNGGDLGKDQPTYPKYAPKLAMTGATPWVTWHQPDDSHPTYQVYVRALE